MLRLDKDTFEVLQRYEKIADAVAEGYHKGSINNCLNGVRPTTGGFRWVRAEEPKQIITEDLLDEKWINLENAEREELRKFKRYSVSNMGRVKLQTGKLVKIDAKYEIKLSHKQKKTSFRIHRLVMLAFNVPNPENKPEVDHIDSDHKNNRLDNLRWATRNENQNNENSTNKMRSVVEVTFPDGHVEVIIGMKNTANYIKIKDKTVRKYAKNGDTYKGYKFKILKNAPQIN